MVCLNYIEIVKGGSMNKTKKIYLCIGIFIILSSLIQVAYAFKNRGITNDLEAKEIISRELVISTSQVELSELINSLSNSEGWKKYQLEHPDAIIYFDPRSGKPVSIIYPIPIIPGDGDGNNLTLEDISAKLNRDVKRITEEEVKALVLLFLKENSGLIGVSMDEVGEIKVGNPSETMWNVHIKRQYKGIPVKDSRISFTIKHGNIVIWGTEKWGDLLINVNPGMREEEALRIGFDYVGGRSQDDFIIVKPHLEIIPIESGWDGSIGKGYKYILAWVYSFKREGYKNVWNVVIDANTGRLLSFNDTNLYATKKILGSIYPVSCDGCCPSGCALQNVPAPYINTGFASPNDYTNYGGFYTYTSGTATTTLDGKYVVIGTDYCGSVSEASSTGDILLGGTNGQHDCTVPSGHSAGDTFSSRSCAIEITHLNRQVASWLNLSWLNNAITCNVNIQDICNAYYSGNSINFFRSSTYCRNTGEIAAVFDHEWAHAVDFADTGGGSSPYEAIADLSAALRLQTSCIGRGFWSGYNLGCGQWTSCPSNPGPSYGYNCDGYNSSECCTQCTGIREIDYEKHVSPDADTIQNYVCAICSTQGSYFGPCGREAHCEGIPAAMVGWDLAMRDLQTAPFNYDNNTAFALANKIVWQGNDNVLNWYSCTCPSTVNACGSTNAYPSWLAADDDDGNINNGTPHMAAIYNAHSRHGMACASPSPINSGCSGGPSTAPSLTAAPSNNSVNLSWTAVPGAANYYVFRTEGVNGCDFGKAKIATVSTTNYTDTQALNGNTYYYTVMPVGANIDCLGKMSNCVQIVPTPTPHASYSSSTISDYCASGGSGNANGIIDPGESITTNITISNDGSANLTNIIGTLSCSTSGVSFPDAMALFPDIAMGANGSSLYPYFTYKLSTAVPCGSALNFNLALNYSQGSNNTSFTHTVGAQAEPLLLNEDFSSGNPPSGWTIVDGGTGGGPAATWTTDNPGDRTPGSPIASPFEIVDSDYASTSATQDEQLISPTINATGCLKVLLKFDNQFHYFQNEIADVDVSTDGGSTFPTNVLRMQHNDDGYPNPNTKQIDITSAIAANPANVKIRWHYYNASFEWWWAIDNVKVSCITYNCNICAPAPEIEVEPVSLLAFGNVLVGNQNTKTITVKNTGNANLIISSVSSPSAPFAITSNNCTGSSIPSNGTCNIDVQFSPTAANVYSGNLIISSNDYDESSYEVKLWGAGVDYLLVGDSINLVGDSNGVIDIGENVSFATSWENESSTNATNVTGSSITADSGVTLEGSANYGDIPAFSTVSCSSTGDCYGILASGPRPSAHWDVTVQETLSTGHIKDWILHIGNSFYDVPVSNPFYYYIENLLHSGVTAGCSTNDYCPSNPVQRSQMAKFICASMEKASSGSCTVGACTQMFSDVPSSNPFCPYIEALYTAGIVSGCSTNPLKYCPNDLTSRQAMAKFICNSMNVANPGSCVATNCTGIFADVPSSNPFCNYIEAVYNAGVVSGCSTSPLKYCPTLNVSRQQMSKFLVNAFDFMLY